MSQKGTAVTKGNPSKGMTSSAPKVTTKSITNGPNKTVQSKSIKKSDEKNERKPNSVLNKNVKNPINSVIDKKNTSLKTNDSKKKMENISKTTTKTVTKPLTKNLNTKSSNVSNPSNIKSQNQSNIKTQNQSNIKLNDSNRKLNVKKTNEMTQKGVTLKRTDKKQNINTNTNVKVEKAASNIHNEPQNKEKSSPRIEEIFNEKSKGIETEDQTNKESSDEQYVSLPTLESYSSYNKKSSESILAEPPSVCDTDIEDMSNLSDNQVNDLPSDYCDDFEDYESDFEDDDDIQQSDEYSNDDNEEIISDKSDKIVQNFQQITNSRENQTNDNILPKVLDVKEINQELNVTPIQSSNIIENNFLTKSVETAKNRSEFENKRNKLLKRSKELLEIIKLDEICFVNFDLPQINYELFIKIFGRKDTKQVSCQTSEREDNETQTDFIQISDKWTQNPSFTPIVSGDENQINEKNQIICFNPRVNSLELIQFLSKAETLTAAIINMECSPLSSKRYTLPKGAEHFSTNISVIKCLSMAKNCPISYTFTNSLYLFCVQNVSRISGSTEKSVISVWSLMGEITEPVRVLICRSHIVRAFAEQNLVVSAMIDGSVALWDLNQSSICDKEFIIESNKFILKTPSYNCALTSKGHDFPIVDIKRFVDKESNESVIHFGTVDESGALILWAITEGKEETNDSILSQTNEHKITKISMTNHLDKFTQESNLIKITAFDCQPNEWSNIYCGTNNGSILRFTTIEESVNNLPKVYQKSYLNSFWTKVSAICFNKSEFSKFLVSFSDGLLSYYSITNENPLIIFNSNEISIIDLKWIPESSLMSFIALNNLNEILIWSLKSEQQFEPIVKYRHSNDRISSISLWRGMKTFLIFGCDSGQTLLFEFCDQQF